MAKSSNCKNDRATRSVAVALEPRTISSSKATQVNKNQTQQQRGGEGERNVLVVEKEGLLMGTIYV